MDEICLGSAVVNEILMRAVVEAAAFFELASDQEVDPDSAVKQLEGIGHLLQQLGPDERSELVAFVTREAERATSEDYREFLWSFADAFGLRDA